MARVGEGSKPNNHLREGGGFYGKGCNRMERNRDLSGGFLFGVVFNCTNGGGVCGRLEKVTQFLMGSPPMDESPNTNKKQEGRER